jgi:hypothetical protein
MRNRTLEMAREKAQRIMDDLEGEGMVTLRELKTMLEREIANRLSSVNPPVEQTPPVHTRADRVFARLVQPAPEEAKT